MGTDDKQRKQASSLPGEICLLLPRVQWDPVRYTRIYTFAGVEYTVEEEEEEEEEDGYTPPTQRCRPVSFFDSQRWGKTVLRQIYR